MAFHHRKLLNESIGDPRTAISCGRFCDDTKNPYGFCPSICFDFCPPACKTPLPEFPPPPARPPPPPAPPIFLLNTPPNKPNRLSLLLTISLAILATTFFLFTCYTIYKFYTNWYNSRRRQSQRHPPEEDGGPDDFLDVDHGPVVDHPIWYIRTIGLQPSVISAITIVKYKRGDGLIEGTDCAVCLNEFQEDETLRLLPKCNHAFHIPCIDTWLRSHTNCPMCRAGIVNNEAAFPSQELIVQNSGLVEENRQEISGEVRRDSENESSELWIGIEDDGISRSQSGLKINENIGGEEGNSAIGGLDGVQPVRRSVSVDSLSASMISSAIANAFPGQSDRNSDNQLVEVKESTVEDIAQRVGFNQSLLRLLGSPSLERSIRTGSSSIKRSVSCSAKVFLSRHSSRNRNSVIPQ